MLLSHWDFLVPLFAWAPQCVVILVVEVEGRASSQEGGGHLTVPGYIPPSAMQEGQRRDRDSCQQVMIHDLVYLQAIQGTV